MFSVLFLLFPQGNKIVQNFFSLFQNRKKSLKMQVFAHFHTEKSKQNFSCSRLGKIFPGLDQEKFFPVQTRKNFSGLEQEKFCLLFSVRRTCTLLHKLSASGLVRLVEKFFLVQTRKNFSRSRPGKILFTFFCMENHNRKKQEKYKKTLCFVYCSNSVLLEPFFIVFNCIFPRFSWFKIDSRNLFRFSACGLEAEKCFLNQF